MAKGTKVTLVFEHDNAAMSTVDFVVPNGESQMTPELVQAIMGACAAPTGYIFFSLAKDPRACELSGVEYRRDQYPALWDVIQTQYSSRLVTDEAWHEVSEANNGQCGLFSTGQDDTVFRVPCLTSAKAEEASLLFSGPKDSVEQTAILGYWQIIAEPVHVTAEILALLGGGKDAT